MSLWQNIKKDFIYWFKKRSENYVLYSFFSELRDMSLDLEMRLYIDFAIESCWIWSFSNSFDHK